jgi:hypothetical protein
MRTIRRRNWFIKRIALGVAIAAFAAPVAQARIDEGIPSQPNAANEGLKPIPYRWPSSGDKILKSSADRIEVVRGLSQSTSSDKIEFVRTQTRSTSPELFGRFATPNSTTGDDVASWNVDWEDAGIGAGLALALVLVGGGAVLATRHVGRAQTA